MKFKNLALVLLAGCVVAYGQLKLPNLQNMKDKLKIPTATTAAPPPAPAATPTPAPETTAPKPAAAPMKTTAAPVTLPPPDPLPGNCAIKAPNSLSVRLRRRIPAPVGM